jgi:hypothetical protein
VARWSFNGATVSSIDLALRGGETKGRDRERKCRQHGSPGGAEATFSKTAAGRMDGVAASDRRRETSRVGRCCTGRLLWLGPTLRNSKEN